MFNLDEVSLMAFSSSDVIASWKEQVVAQESLKEQTLDITEHVNRAHRDAYAQNAHTENGQYCLKKS